MNVRVDLLPGLLKRIALIPVKLCNGFFDLLLVFENGAHHFLESGLSLLHAGDINQYMTDRELEMNVDEPVNGVEHLRVNLLFHTLLLFLQLARFLS